MKGIKRLLITLLAGIMILGTVGCGGESAEQAVQNMLDAVKAADSEKASKYMDYDELVNQDEEEGTKGIADAASSEEMVQLILKNLSYKIISSKEDGDKATVEVEITNTDMSSLMGDFISRALGLAFSGIDEKQMEVKMMEIFTELMNSKENKTATATVKISLNKEDNQWKVDTSDELVDAILGGMMTAAENMKSSFGGDSGEDKISEDTIE